MALLSKGSSLISGGIWRRILARRRRTGRGGGGAVSHASPCLAQPLLAQASLVAGCGGGGVPAALQQGACAVSSPGREPAVAQASSFVGSEALQHVSAGGGSLLPSMLLNFASLCCSSSDCSQVLNHRRDRGSTCKRSCRSTIFVLVAVYRKTHPWPAPRRFEHTAQCAWPCRGSRAQPSRGPRDT